MTISEYVHALKHFDWYYEYSDDHRVWKSGVEQLQHLRNHQAVLDPDMTIWRQYAKK